MVEMTEAAAILHGATEQSLVLMDEIGRGTSTFDGLALAGAIASHLHDRNRAFTLFATHYFELTELPGASTTRALNVHVSAVESGGTTSSSCTRSSPARPAAATACRWRGWPACRAALVRQARATLEALEAQQRAGRGAGRPVRRRRRAPPRRRRSPLDDALATHRP